MNMNYADTRASDRTLCRFSFSAVAALTAFAITSNVVYAGTEDTLPTITVNYGDLNLANSAGVETLYRRIRTAATKVCRQFDQRPLNRRIKWQQCHDGAFGAAVLDVNHPSLSALYAKRGGTLMTAEIRTARATPK
jgi:UrcA family protein